MSTSKKRPLLIYDGDCAFCQMCVDYAKAKTGAKVNYEPYQKVAKKHSKIPVSHFKKAIQLVDSNGEVYSAAQAAHKTLAYSGSWLWKIGNWKYGRIPGYKGLSEWFYRLVARNRGFAFKVTRFLFGPTLEPAKHNMVRELFLCFLGLIYFVAFVSFGVQALGLIGSAGILPLDHYLDHLMNRFGDKAYYLAPIVFWFSSSDAMILGTAGLGALLSVLLFFGKLRKLSLLVLFFLYLSLVYAGQIFMSFQWDVLLLEVGFLALLFSFSTQIVWLFRWLLFRLTFMIGASKLLSQDEAWRSLTALEYHYETQPLPTGIAWYLHQLPTWFQTTSVVIMFAIQLVLPFFFFAPRRLRFVAAFFVGFLELMILISGNYNFFNILTLGLVFLLLDDRAVESLGCTKLVNKLKTFVNQPNRFKTVVLSLASVVILVVSLSLMTRSFTGKFPAFILPLRQIIAPYNIVNSYGLFAVMTTERREVVVEGSNDQKEWKEYVLKHKPHDLDRKPTWIAPHQPRLDWQMWFAALGNYQNHPWFVNYAKTLLDGSPEVLRLIKTNPFPDNPPKYIRAVGYDYHFTTPQERRETGNWWKRERVGLYMPPVSLDLFYRPGEQPKNPPERHEP